MRRLQEPLVNQSEGAENMRTVKQAIHPVDSTRGLHAWEPTEKKRSKLLTTVQVSPK